MGGGTMGYSKAASARGTKRRVFGCLKFFFPMFTVVEKKFLIGGKTLVDR